MGSCGQRTQKRNEKKMSKIRKIDAILGGGRPIISRKAPVVHITSGTIGTGCTRKGIVALVGSTAGITNGNVYVTIDTSGTGSKMNA